MHNNSKKFEIGTVRPTKKAPVMELFLFVLLELLLFYKLPLFVNNWLALFANSTIVDIQGIAIEPVAPDFFILIKVPNQRMVIIGNPVNAIFIGSIHFRRFPYIK